MTVSLLMGHLILWGTKTILGVFSEIEAFPFLPFLNTSYFIYAPWNNSIFSIAVFAKQRRSVRYFFYPSTKFLCRPREFFLYWTFAWFLLSAIFWITSYIDTTCGMGWPGAVGMTSLRSWDIRYWAGEYWYPCWDGFLMPKESKPSQVLVLKTRFLETRIWLWWLS